MAQLARSPLERLREPFAIPSYRFLWIGAVLFALGSWTERVAIGWYVFDVTDSAFLTAVATAAIVAPGMLIGPFAGAISDRAARPRVLAFSGLLKAAALLAIAVLVRSPEAPLPLIVLLIAVSGAGNSLNISSLHTLSGDLVGARRRARAITIVSVGQRGVSAIGAVSGAAVIAAFGATWSFALAAAVLALSAFAYRTVREPTARGSGANVAFLADTFEGLRVVGRVPMVALLLALTVLVEIFGFAFLALLPAVAVRILDVGELGLGGLSGAAPIGGVAGMLVLAAYAERERMGVFFLGVVASFGTLMVLMGVSQWYALSIVVAAGLGWCAASFDALQWILLQQAVDDRLRGRAMGAWNVAIGFGWIGPLTLGAIADATTVTAAFVLAGMVLIVTAAVVTVTAPTLRNLANAAHAEDEPDSDDLVGDS